MKATAWPAEAAIWMELFSIINRKVWGAVKDKCYADKPEIIDALKDNIREAIGEIQSIGAHNW